MSIVYTCARITPVSKLLNFRTLLEKERKLTAKEDNVRRRQVRKMGFYFLKQRKCRKRPIKCRIYSSHFTNGHGYINPLLDCDIVQYISVPGKGRGERKIRRGSKRVAPFILTLKDHSDPSSGREGRGEGRQCSNGYKCQLAKTIQQM